MDELKRVDNAYCHCCNARHRSFNGNMPKYKDKDLVGMPIVVYFRETNGMYSFCDEVCLVEFFRRVADARERAQKAKTPEELKAAAYAHCPELGQVSAYDRMHGRKLLKG